MRGSGTCLTPSSPNTLPTLRRARRRAWGTATPAAGARTCCRRAERVGCERGARVPLPLAPALTPPLASPPSPPHAYRAAWRSASTTGASPRRAPCWARCCGWRSTTTGGAPTCSDGSGPRSLGLLARPLPPALPCRVALEPQPPPLAVRPSLARASCSPPCTATLPPPSLPPSPLALPPRKAWCNVWHSLRGGRLLARHPPRSPTPTQARAARRRLLHARSASPS